MSSGTGRKWVLAVKTQYHINGQASHRYWKLVTLPLQSSPFLLLTRPLYIYGALPSSGPFKPSKPLHVQDGHNGQLAKLMYNLNGSCNKTVKTIYYVVIYGFLLTATSSYQAWRRGLRLEGPEE